LLRVCREIVPMEFLLTVLASAVGGVAAGLFVARLTRGNMTGGLLGGMIGAMAAHFTLYPSGEQALPGLLVATLQGAAGGAALGLAAGFMMKKKT